MIQVLIPSQLTAYTDGATRVTAEGATVNAVLAAVRHRGGQARLGAPLYSDSTGEDGTAEGTYLGMVRANAERIAEGLR